MTFHPGPARHSLPIECRTGPFSFLGGTGVASQVTPWMGNHIGMAPLNEGLTAELQHDLEGAKLTLPPHLQIGASTAPPRNAL